VIVAAGHGWGLAIFPLLAAVIALVFAAMLAQRVAHRWRPHEAVWLLALLMYAVASGAMFLGVHSGWTASTYRIYWLFGAVLNVPYLAQGEVYLLVRDRRIAHAIFGCLVVLSMIAAAIVWTSTVHTAELARDLPLGDHAWRESRLPYHLRWLSWIGYVALVAGLVWSARAMKGKPELRGRTAGMLGIAAGATIVAIGSGVGAGLNVVPLFSVSLAVGIAVMFWGFLRVSHSSARQQAPVI
jgi:hypothetical protein